ncbi:hypothetical protein BTA51_04630 [Hahella sp. CCB-MM4]|uniref:hypothetical protein n=1 Tax=Hahella sp. (strain CCB-MM4) TaxID=1926491 RepID=UPI000B9B04F5|nr:hypothetical protein [Hahella sp. CCB-MM4]OZG74303.1 hypothetical protein BTA51_04630 [Hahella sp. CCB-MM4]
MMQLTPYRKLILTVEFIALVVLIGSMVIFGQFTENGEPPAPILWLIPITASFLVISGFSANLYIRWIESADTRQANTIQRLFIYLLIASLYLIWFFAIGQAWLSHQLVSAAS